MPALARSLAAAVALVVLAAAAGGGGAPAAPARGFACPARPALGDSIDGANFRVWYGTGDRGRAVALLGQLMRANQRLAFMQKPVDDAASCSSGGSPLIDFYLVENTHPSAWDPGDKTVGVVILPPERPTQMSGFVEIDRGLSGLAQGCAAAHAYMHVMQARYGFNNLARNRWWYEATANFAEFSFDARCPQPHADAAQFLARKSGLPLELLSPYPDNYGTWLLPLYMQKKVNPRFVSSVFEKMGAARVDAVDAIDDQYWRGSFPDFALRLWNLGKVDDFKGWKATDQRVFARRLDANLRGKATRETDVAVKVYPTASQHVLVDLLDVNTRYATIDLSDFAAKQDIRIKVLKQPTLGPNPAARALEWDEAAIEDWTGARKKHLCRDSADEDHQQILIAISNINPDGDPVRGRVKVKSEAFCRWSANATLAETGKPPEGNDFVFSTGGALAAASAWRLTPGEDPIVCPGAKRACLPFTGALANRATWWAEAEAEPDPLNHESYHTRIDVSGTSNFTFKPQPSTGGPPNPALFQEMEWDADLEQFRPIMSVALTTTRWVNGRFVDKTPTTKARWDTTGSGGGCDELLPDWTYTGVNNSGAVSHTWTSCLSDDTNSYGLMEGLYLDQVITFPSGAKPQPGNPERSGPCTDGALYTPWGPQSAAWCWSLWLEPHPGTASQVLGYTGIATPPPALASEGWLSTKGCRDLGRPCPVEANALGDELTEWPVTMTVKVTLRKLPNR